MKSPNIIYFLLELVPIANVHDYSEQDITSALIGIDIYI